MSRIKRYMKPGDRVRTVGCYSEAMCHMGLAGRPVEVELRAKLYQGGRAYSAQCYMDGKPVSFPVLTGEAGIMEDEGGFYCYADDGPGDEDPKAEERRMYELIRNALNS